MHGKFLKPSWFSAPRACLLDCSGSGSNPARWSWAVRQRFSRTVLSWTLQILLEVESLGLPCRLRINHIFIATTFLVDSGFFRGHILKALHQPSHFQVYHLVWHHDLYDGIHLCDHFSNDLSGTYGAVPFFIRYDLDAYNPHTPHSHHTHTHVRVRSHAKKEIRSLPHAHTRVCAFVHTQIREWKAL